MADTVQAKARYIPMSPMKVRRIIDAVRGMGAQAAMDALNAMPQAAALPVSKLIHSAVANADEVGLDINNLFIAQIAADEAPGVMPGKGWRARWGSRGRYRPIRKRSSHITVVLEERQG